jgi:putative two-component system response regulator
MNTIIAIDDTQTNLVLYRYLLKSLPETAMEGFEDPAAALVWLAAPEEMHPADLILLDYMMPGIDGLEFMRRLAEIPHRRDTPVVMVTADNESDVRYRALEAGARDFLTKPIDKAELRARAQNQLALRQAQRQLAARAAWLAEEVKKATSEIRSRERETILRLSRAAEYRDPETGGHLQRMARYSELVARGLGLPQVECELILEAAPMHDIGKVGISDDILLKPGQLTAEEFTLMKRHAEIGHAILADSPSPLMQCAAAIALSHHEKWDGSGYPQGLAGEAIPLHGRIVAVADVFDALSSTRPYKSAWPLEKALDLLRDQAGRHFDPACIASFFDALPQALAIQEQYQDPGQEPV